LILFAKGALSVFAVGHNSLFDPLPVLYNHVVNDLSAEDTSPLPKTLLVTEELFISHGSATAITLHYINPTGNYQGVYQEEFMRSRRR
jgi:hypothetical protein